MQALRPFHLAVPVHDIPKARAFYGELMGFEEGRSSDHWVDYNFYGHQFVVHLDPNKKAYDPVSNPVDGKQVPIPHFGVVLSLEDWEALAERLKAEGMAFVIEPYIRFKGEAGEQATMFFLDPSGNALEFKAFKDLSSLFEK